MYLCNMIRKVGEHAFLRNYNPKENKHHPPETFRKMAMSKNPFGQDSTAKCIDILITWFLQYIL